MDWSVVGSRLDGWYMDLVEQSLPTGLVILFPWVSIHACFGMCERKKRGFLLVGGFDLVQQ